MYPPSSPLFASHPLKHAALSHALTFLQPRCLTFHRVSSISALLPSHAVCPATPLGCGPSVWNGLSPSSCSYDCGQGKSGNSFCIAGGRWVSSLPRPVCTRAFTTNHSAIQARPGPVFWETPLILEPLTVWGYHVRPLQRQSSPQWLQVLAGVKIGPGIFTLRLLHREAVGSPSQGYQQRLSVVIEPRLDIQSAGLVSAYSCAATEVFKVCVLHDTLYRIVCHCHHVLVLP